ncbi:MAG: hypothetical protein E7077_04255 [Bacteroidales bacterium]|nr:hypothetical protein [Bacteroidales bacterium]
MGKKKLSNKDFVKEYEEATNIPEILSTTTKFCFLTLGYISLLIVFISFVISTIIFFSLIFLDTLKKGFFNVVIFFLLLLIIILNAPALVFLPLLIYATIRKIVFTIKENIEKYINDFKQYKAAKKRKKNFLVEIGMSMREATRRYNFILKEAIYVQSLQKICKLNPQTRSGQVEMIKNWYKFKDTALVEYLLNNEYNESDFNMYVGHFEIKNFSEKKSFTELLFKLAILEDGIHNDEWKVLMNLLVELKFNENYIEYFKKRYNPLRTEFDDYEHNTETANEYHSVSLLKPYYDILGVDENASDEEIKRAYHNLALQHHPDLAKNAGRVKESELMMAKINEAYEKIRN